MKTRLTLSFLAAAMCCFAQNWEVGASAGLSFLPGASVTSSLGPATAGFKSGVSCGGFIGQNLYRHLSGEVHYKFIKSDLRLQSGGTSASFSGVSHVVHYDLVFHTNREGSRTQYFAVAGGGLKVFRGTGTESAYQPLSQFGFFTKTQELKPMASVGGGVKFSLSPRLYLRAEVRDYITMFPKELLAPAPGAKFGGLLHDFVPTIGISYVY